MKKTFLLVALFAFLTSNAQKINFGIKAGLNMSSFSGASDVDVNSSTGFHAGGFVEFKALGKIAIQPELLFSAQGAKLDKKDVSSSTSKLNYVLVPVMLKYYSIAGLFVEAGPQVGFLVSAKNDFEDKISNITTSTDVKDKTNGLDLAANLGVGYDILDKVVVQARYSLGLTKVSTVENVNYKNGVFQLSLGYKF